MRKRGKSRFSSGPKRALRFRLKYATDPLCHRAKVLLPVKYAHLKTALINLDDFEITLFSAFEAEGIPSELWPFYMAWAKRKMKKGLKFWDSTFTLEGELLRQEFVLRGLDMTTLNNLEPIVDAWISAFRGVECPFEFISSWDSGDLHEWDSGTASDWDFPTDPIHHGAYSIKSKVNGADLIHNIAGTPSPYYLRLFFMLTGTIPNDSAWSPLLHFANTYLYAKIQSGGASNSRLVLHNQTNDHYAIGSTPVTFNVWHKLVLKTYGNTNPCTHVLKLDGAVEIELDDDTTPWPLNQFFLSGIALTFGYTLKSLYDCLILDRNTEPSEDYYLLCDV
jgi:hypothetical protein